MRHAWGMGPERLSVESGPSLPSVGPGPRSEMSVLIAAELVAMAPTEGMARAAISAKCMVRTSPSDLGGRTVETGGSMPSEGTLILCV